MTRASQDEPPPANPEPRWPAIIAVLASGGLYTALPDALTVGPRWLFPSLVLALLIPTIFTHRRGQHRLNALLSVVITGVLTTGLLLALLLLIAALPAHKEPPTAMLVSAVALWTTNILVFALWYWRLDAGGPHSREHRAGHPDGAFLFPQMTMETSALREAGQSQWSPNFVDYLFLAFTTSTALSPTDTPVLARWAKLLMMLQAFISLLILALLAARAVNIL
jgi:hypothetical protein